MDLPEPMCAGFALAATIAGDKAAALAARGLDPDLQGALTALPQELARATRVERHERIRELAERVRFARAETDEADARASDMLPLPAPSGVLEEARAQAAEIVAKAHVQAEALRTQALSEARAIGQAEQAKALLVLTAAGRAALAELEHSAMQAGLQVASHLVGKAIELQPSLIVDVVAPLLARVRRASTLRLHVHPSDAPALRGALPSLVAQHELTGAPELVLDGTLTRGGCVVESNIGELDARIETRLDALTRALGGPQP